MRAVGIITEYNPLHNGHAYHIARAKELAHANYAVAVMSGDFVQRGEPALASKHVRAKWALQSGADLVLALPAPFSLASAEGFARGAVGILAGSGIIQALCFGSECADLSALRHAAQALNSEPPQAARALREQLRAGQSFPHARAAAFGIYDKQLEAALSRPNDVLGIEYLRALSRAGSAIEPFALRREGAAHDAAAPGGGYASASALRAHILSGEPSALSQYAPPEVCSDIARLHAAGRLISPSNLSQAMLFALRRMTKEELLGLNDVREGLENVLYRGCREAAALEELLQRIKTRRYTLARLKRICMCVLLGITKSDLSAAYAANYIRVLGVKKSALPLLGALCAASSLPVVIKYADAAALNPAQRRLHDIDTLAAEIAALGAQSPQPAPFDYGMPLLVLD
ncbi:MAG: nucleotidyltransferase family protein [Christensenellaceae bacterium]|jgi:predicted nucleotidyltransferase|nr:nucleotidyltransferase family protein [Christensenellaceae bacterium]